jgi:hypothetical protein
MHPTLDRTQADVLRTRHGTHRRALSNRSDYGDPLLHVRTFLAMLILQNPQHTQRLTPARPVEAAVPWKPRTLPPLLGKPRRRVFHSYHRPLFLTLIN